MLNDTIFPFCFILFVFVDWGVFIVYYSLFYIFPLILIKNVF